MAVSPLESRTETQTDNQPLLMDHQQHAGRHEHAIDMSRDDAASSSASHRDNHDGSDELHHVGGPSTRVPPPLSGSSSGATTASNSRNASFARRGDNHGRRRRSPLNSGLWISIELVVNVSQIIAAISVLSISKDEHPRAPLFEWVVGYTVGCVATLPHLYWRYIHRNRHSSEQEAVRQNNSPNNTPESNSYGVISSEGQNGTNRTAVSEANVITANPRFHALVDHFKMALDCFFAVWFVVGNVWMFGGHSSAHDAPNLYKLCIVFLTFSCIGYAMPFILCAMICCCLPCIISVMGFREDLNQNRGATTEAINTLPTYKFKSKRFRTGEGSEDGGGVVAAGTDKERIVSAEDAVCCICLAKYADDDELRELPCTHFFHTECVDKWLKINALCPLCKAEVGSSTSAPSLSFGRRHSDNRVGNDMESQQ